MGIGIPSFLERFGKSIIENSRASQKMLTKMYYMYAYKNIRLRTWYKCGQKYNAEIDPFDLLYISPNCINYSPIERFGHNYVSDVLEGEWDKRVEPFESRPVVSAFCTRYEQNSSWEETEYYQNKQEIIQNGGKWKGCTSLLQLEKQFRAYDELFQNIKNNGYKNQSQLEEENRIIESIHELKYHPPELREITVDIDRDGNFIWYWGQHRLAIAQIADVDSVPVRVRYRHKRWQEKRERAYNEGTETTHPDLKDD